VPPGQVSGGGLPRILFTIAAASARPRPMTGTSSAVTSACAGSRPAMASVRCSPPPTMIEIDDTGRG